MAAWNQTIHVLELDFHTDLTLYPCFELLRFLLELRLPSLMLAFDLSKVILMLAFDPSKVLLMLAFDLSKVLLMLALDLSNLAFELSFFLSVISISLSKQQFSSFRLLLVRPDRRHCVIRKYRYFLNFFLPQCFQVLFITHCCAS